MICRARFDVGTFLCDGNLRMHDAVLAQRKCCFVAQKPSSTSLDFAIAEAECKNFLPFRTFLCLCNNTLWETIENVGFHLVWNRMIETYSIWNLHDEQLDNALSSNATRVDNVEPIVDPNEQVMDIINDTFPFASTNMNQEGEDDVPTPMDSAEFEQYEQHLKSANQELYLWCESFSVLTAIVELMHGKIKYRMSNLCSDYFLGVFKRMLPTDNCLSKDHR
ncbi:unnamed protein product, partial [Prunus brigantina]